MSVVIDFLAGAFLLTGGFFCVVGGIGLIRMPDFYTRMHAASVTETLGAGLILLGLILLGGWTLITMKLVMVGLLIFFASPTASHALARSAMLRGVKPQLASPDTKGDPSSKP